MSSDFFATLRRELLNLLTLNLLFIISCIPIITIPASLTAMARITGMMVQDKNCYVWGDYIKAFKSEFFKALLGGAVFSAALALFILAGLVYYSIFGQSPIFIIIAGFAACLIIFVLMASVYYWTMLAFVNLKVKDLLKNSFILVFGCWKRTLIAAAAGAVHLLFVVGLAPAGIGKTTALTDIWLFGTFLIGFSLHSLIISYAVWPAVNERVIMRDEAPKKPSATLLGSDKPLEWDDDTEIKSAGTDSLKWD